MFPEMEPEDFQNLVTGLKLNGFRKSDPIYTLKGEILDGRNRWNASQAAGVKPIIVPFKGTQAEALSFVVARNLHRRHLSTSQRAMIAAEISKCQNSDTSLSEAAETLHVSRQSATQAAKLKKASPKLAGQVKSGKKSLNAAAKEAGINKSKHEKPAPHLPTAQQSHDAVYGTGAVKTDKKPKSDKSKLSPGQICRDAYFDKAGGKVESWEEIPAKERAAWIAAADAVKKLA